MGHSGVVESDRLVVSPSRPQLVLRNRGLLWFLSMHWMHHSIGLLSHELDNLIAGNNTHTLGPLGVQVDEFSQALRFL